MYKSNLKGKALNKYDKAKDVASVKGVEVLDKAKEIATKSGVAAASFIKKYPKELGAAAVTSLLVYGSYKVYKRFFSAAAKACAGKSGSEKTACMKKYKIDAIRAQISDLNRSKGACNKTNNPEACKHKIDGKIAHLKNKLEG